MKTEKMERQIGLLDTTVLIEKDGIKELIAKYDATDEKKYYLLITDGSGTKSINISKALYLKLTSGFLTPPNE